MTEGERDADLMNAPPARRGNGRASRTRKGGRAGGAAGQSHAKRWRAKKSTGTRSGARKRWKRVGRAKIGAAGTAPPPAPIEATPLPPLPPPPPPPSPPPALHETLTSVASLCSDDSSGTSLQSADQASPLVARSVLVLPPRPKTSRQVRNPDPDAFADYVVPSPKQDGAASPSVLRLEEEGGEDKEDEECGEERGGAESAEEDRAGVARPRGEERGRRGKTRRSAAAPAEAAAAVEGEAEGEGAEELAALGRRLLASIMVA